MARSRAWRLVDLAVDAGVSLVGRYRSRRAAFLGHERTLIGNARMGELVKVVGRLRGGGEPLRAPLTAATCLWYRTAAKRVESGNPFPPFDLLAREIVEEEATDLWLDDESGTAVVHARGARFSLVEMRSGWFQDPPRSSGGDAARRFLERYAVAADRHSGSNQEQLCVMYRETVLRPGDTVAVLGRPTIEADPAGGGIGARTPATRVVFGGEPGAVIVSNEPGVWS